MTTRDKCIPVQPDSDSEDAEESHPVDAVIQAAISRQQSPMPIADQKLRPSKRKRQDSIDLDVVPVHSSSEGNSSASDKYDVTQDQAPSQAGHAAALAPIGVTVVEEGAQTRNAEVQRLLRGARQVFYLEHAVLDPVSKCSHARHHAGLQDC